MLISLVDVVLCMKSWLKLKNSLAYQEWSSINWLQTHWNQKSRTCTVFGYTRRFQTLEIFEIHEMLGLLWFKLNKNCIFGKTNPSEISVDVLNELISRIWYGVAFLSSVSMSIHFMNNRSICSCCYLVSFVEPHFVAWVLKLFVHRSTFCMCLRNK